MKAAWKQHSTTSWEWIPCLSWAAEGSDPRIRAPCSITVGKPGRCESAAWIVETHAAAISRLSRRPNIPLIPRFVSEAHPGGAEFGNLYSLISGLSSIARTDYRQIACQIHGSSDRLEASCRKLLILMMKSDPNAFCSNGDNEAQRAVRYQN